MSRRCPACDGESDLIYRCTHCGKDLAGIGGGGGEDA